MTQRRFGWFYFVPTLVVLGAANAAGNGKLAGSTALTVAVVRMAVGAAWQLIDRRDLTDRLTYFAVLFVGTVVVFALRWNESLGEVPTSLALAVGGAITGCVLGEQFLRFAATRRARRLTRDLSLSQAA